MLWKRATSLQTMSALLSSQSISGAPAASPLPWARRCSWSAAAAAFARHRRGRAWCCCCVAGAADSGVGDSLLVAACRTVAVAGTLLAESLRLQRVECLSEIMSTCIVFSCPVDFLHPIGRGGVVASCGVLAHLASAVAPGGWRANLEIRYVHTCWWLRTLLPSSMLFALRVNNALYRAIVYQTVAAVN